MKQITTTEFAKVLHEHPMKVKRHARELFGYDEIAGRQTGYARMLSVADDCLPLGLFTYLVSFHKLSIPDAKTIIKDIKPILKELTILPLTYERWKTFMLDGKALYWDIDIFFKKSGRHLFVVNAGFENKILEENFDGHSGWVEQTKVFHQKWYKGKIYGLKDSLEDGEPDDWRGMTLELSLFTDALVPGLEKAGYL